MQSAGSLFLELDDEWLLGGQIHTFTLTPIGRVLSMEK